MLLTTPKSRLIGFTLAVSQAVAKHIYVPVSYTHLVRKYLSIEELTHTLLREMVEKIVVYECEYDENEVDVYKRQVYEQYRAFHRSVLYRGGA